MSELADLCNKLNITIENEYKGYSKWEPDSKSFRFDWLCTLSYNGRKFKTEFHSGCGNSTLKKPWLNERNGLYNPNTAKLIKHYSDEAMKEVYIATESSIADVLHCLLSDADAIHCTFDQWCDNLGYSNDSIKAKKIYDTCLETGIRLRQFIGDDLIFNQLANLEH